MATPLAPPPPSLGLSSPELGAWFVPDVSLGRPDEKLRIQLPAGKNLSWYAPASALASLFLATDPRPLGLAHLRDGRGALAFDTGSLIVLLQIVPEVEARLHFLARYLPSADGAATSSRPTRARVRYLAIEVPGFTNLNTVVGLLPTLPAGLGSDPNKLAAYLGFKNTSGSGTITGNADQPTTHLERPFTVATVDPVLKTLDGNAYLWAFDGHGHALDPGAVAAWWKYLGTQFTNLLATAPGASAARTADVVAGRGFQLTNPHGTPLATDGKGLLPLLTTANTTGTGSLRWASADGGIKISAPATADASPTARVALSPNGSHAAEVTIFQTTTPGLARDHVRVVAVDVEAFLVGQERVSANDADPAQKAAAKRQLGASTRVDVARCRQRPVLAETIDAANRHLLGVFDAAGRGPARLVTSVVTHDVGFLDTTGFLASLPAAGLPSDLGSDKLAAFALQGGGAVTSANRVVGQRVLVKVSLGAALAGAWVRIWPEGLDDRIGEHTRMDGGAGRADAGGDAYVVVTLPDGPVPAPAPLGVNVLVVTQHTPAGTAPRLRSRLYADKRFVRPMPVGGNPITPGSAAGVRVCETGKADATALAQAPSGANLVAPLAAGNTWTLVHPAGTGDGKTLEKKARPGDVVSAVMPAFKNVPDHLGATLDPAGQAADAAAATAGLASGVVGDRIGRNGLAALVGASEPLATLERLEVACATFNSDEAAVGSAPTLGRYHEVLPHHLGHPGAPGAADLHGTGAHLTGAAALLVNEHVRERTAGLAFTTPKLPPRSTAALMLEALVKPPTITPATAPMPWTAVLRTVAAGVDGEPLVNGTLYNTLFPVAEKLTEFKTWLDGQLANLITQLQNNLPLGTSIAPPTMTNLGPFARALDRRVLIGHKGAREGAISLEAAIRRAEDFVYIETPALDSERCGPTNDADTVSTGVIDALIRRAGERPGLRVLICVPLQLMPGTPRAIRDVRNAMLLDAIKELRAVADDRVAIFIPSAGTGRSLRLASTTVIVDDVYGLTGTTHLSRRGLSFDSSLAVALFDEQLDEGKSADVLRFRRALVAGRLGVDAALVPDDPIELVGAVRHELTRGGSYRFAEDALRYPEPLIAGTGYPTDDDKKVWNPDGAGGFDLTTLASALVRATSGTAGPDDELV